MEIDDSEGVLCKMKSTSRLLHLCAADTVSVITTLEDACGSLDSWDGLYVALISNEWETGCSLSKAGADSDTLDPAPQITQQCYLPEDTIKETHQSSVSGAEAAHMHAFNMGPGRTPTCSLNHVLITDEYSTAWLIMKEQLGLSIIGFEPNPARLLHSRLFFTVSRLATCWCVWPNCWTSGWISGLPAHLKACISYSFFFSPI